VQSTTVSELKSVTLEMTVQEAKHFLRDPQPAQEHVRGLLRAKGETDVPAEPLTRTPRGGAAGGFNCPVCGKPVKTASGLKAHHTQKHAGKAGK
jgi:hypothetical protein